MIDFVIKKDGSKEKYDFSKIITAINKAVISLGYPDLNSEFNFNDLKSNLFKLPSESTVEEIQDVVENYLMDSFPNSIAKAYILYRAEHKETRSMLERINYMNSYKNSSNNAASSSETDANANVAIKNVANLEGEVYKTTNRKLQRLQMKLKLKELYPDTDLHKQYIEDLEHHIIYTHDEASSPVPKNYCEAVSMYPLVNEGVGNMDGVTPNPPKWLNSFCGQFNNLVFLLSAQCKGAVAFGEFFNYFDYYCVQEFGEDYHLKENLLATSKNVKHKQTIGDKINEAFQSIVYYVNQPAGNRSYQSPFTNISYYDKNYWYALFETFYFPDGTQPSWERVSWLQKRFMKWFNKERQSAMLTFFVETMALLTDGKDVIDKEYKEFTAEMQAEGHSFFVYLSDNPNGLASCCRLRNEIEENVFSFTNGLTGVMTGSCNVITLNLNRIVQDWFRSIGGKYPIDRFDTDFKQYLTTILERVYKYHIAYKTILYEWEKAGMFTSSNAGYIYMNKLFSTIGINGINEAARFLGIEVSYNKDYQEFCALITGTIKEQNKLHSTKDFKFNCEFVPKRSGHVKPLLIDSKFHTIISANPTCMDNEAQATFKCAA